MAAAQTPDKDDKTESNKAQAVRKFLVPVAVAWLLAVAGLLSWGTDTMTLLNDVHLLALAAAAALAFLTVVLSGLQDLPSDEMAQKLLFPRRRPAYPSYRAFTKAMIKKARLTDADFPTLDFPALRKSSAAQNTRWFEAYSKRRTHPAIAHFSTRHVAWRDTVPLLILELILTVIILASVLWLGGAWRGWAILAGLTFAMLVLSWLAGRHCSIALVATVLRELAQESRGRARPRGKRATTRGQSGAAPPSASPS